METNLGYGDQILATGLAKGALKRGKRIAFGDGQRIIWDHRSPVVFRGNPNIAPPGSEHRHDIEWVPFYKGHRLYNFHDRERKRWVWNMEFRPTPGEIFLNPGEAASAAAHGEGFVLIEPNVETWKLSSSNKDWGVVKYQQVASRLLRDGHRVVQFGYSRTVVAPLAGVTVIKTNEFRDALAIVSRASLYVGAEGGLHHAAAAFGIPGVVLFGGWIPPSVTGYDMHVNLAVGDQACGALYPCKHCRAAMISITVDQVYSAASEILNGRAQASRRAV